MLSFAGSTFTCTPFPASVLAGGPGWALFVGLQEREGSVAVDLVAVSVLDEAEMLPASWDTAVKLFCSTEHSCVCKVTAQQ